MRVDDAQIVATTLGDGKFGVLSQSEMYSSSYCATIMICDDIYWYPNATKASREGDGLAQMTRRLCHSPTTTK